jgi:hypothetical protein
MYGVAAKVAEKVAMLLQHGGSYARTGQDQTKNQPGWAAADNAASRLGRGSRHVMNYPRRI